MRYMHMIVAVFLARAALDIFFRCPLSNLKVSLTKNGSVKRHKSQKKHSTKDTKKQKKSVDTKKRFATKV
jgi:hypothetical protein